MKIISVPSNTNTITAGITTTITEDYINMTNVVIKRK